MTTDHTTEAHQLRAKAADLIERAHAERSDDIYQQAVLLQERANSRRRELDPYPMTAPVGVACGRRARRAPPHRSRAAAPSRPGLVLKHDQRPGHGHITAWAGRGKGGEVQATRVAVYRPDEAIEHPSGPPELLAPGLAPEPAAGREDVLERAAQMAALQRRALGARDRAIVEALEADYSLGRIAQATELSRAAIVHIRDREVIRRGEQQQEH